MQALPFIIDAESLDFSEFVTWSAGFPDPYRSAAAAAGQATNGFPQLPQPLQDALRQFRERTYAGALLIRGLPIVADLPATPTEPFIQTGLRSIGTEPLLFSITSSLGHPYSYRQWEAGLLVHNKYPIREHAAVQYGSNSVLFRMHTETPFRDFSPDYVCLLCLRGDPEDCAETYICDIRCAIMTLPESAAQALSMPMYAFETDNPYLTKDGVGYTMPRPIVLERNGRVIYEYVDDLSALSKGAQDALELLRKAVRSATREIRLRAGELLVLDNCHIVHGRSSYRPKYDGKDRWLQRLLVSNKLSQIELMSNSYLISDSCISGYSNQYRKVLEDQFLTHG
jgi:L-asparagine oxygenase